MMCLISLHRLCRPRVKKASRFKMTAKKFLEMGACRLDKVQTTKRPLTPKLATVRNPPRKTRMNWITHLMKLYRHSSQQQSTVVPKTIMCNLSRRQVNDSDLLEMLADQRGIEMLPSTPSSNRCRTDIEEYDDATQSEITSQMRRRASV